MSFNPENISILGASGAIGGAFTKHLSEKHPNASMFAFSRNSQHSIDYSCEDSLAEAAELATKEKPLDLLRGWHRCLKHLCWRDEIKTFKINTFSDEQAA